MGEVGHIWLKTTSLHSSYNSDVEFHDLYFYILYTIFFCGFYQPKAREKYYMIKNAEYIFQNISHPNNSLLRKSVS